MPLTLPTAGYFEFRYDFSREKYNSDFLDALNAAIPNEVRSYDSQKWIWTIREKWYQVAREIYQRYYGVPNYDLFDE